MQSPHIWPEYCKKLEVEAFRNLVNIAKQVARQEIEKGFQEKFCLPLSEARALQAGSELKRAYVDPLMRHNCTQYGQFVSSLCSRGVLELCATPGLTEVGFFAVAKKNERQRLVVDARTANQHFRDPPGTQLPMGTTFTSLCAERSEGMFLEAWTSKTTFII